MPKIILASVEGKDVSVEYNTDDLEEITRFDFADNFAIGHVTKTDTGELRGTAPIAKIGILTYLLADGTTRKELVTGKVLFNTDSMNSLKLRPITNTHPNEVLLDTTTVKKRQVGFTGETIKQDGTHLVTSIVINDAEAIGAVDYGRIQLSPGYKSLVLQKSGIFENEHYDAIQIKRVYNHVAICDRARGGPTLKLNIDSVDHIDGFDIPNTITKKGPVMPQITINKINYEAAQEVINHVDALAAQVVDLENKAKVAKSDFSTLQAKTDELTEKNDELLGRDISAEIATGVKQRLNLVNLATVAIKKDELDDLSDLSDIDIKKKIILAKFPKAKLDDKDDMYIQSRLDSIAENSDFDANAIHKQSANSASRSDGNNSTDAIEQAKADSEKNITSAYTELGK